MSLRPNTRAGWANRLVGDRLVPTRARDDGERIRIAVDDQLQSCELLLREVSDLIGSHANQTRREAVQARIAALLEGT